MCLGEPAALAVALLWQLLKPAMVFAAFHQNPKLWSGVAPLEFILLQTRFNAPLNLESNKKWCCYEAFFQIVLQQSAVLYNFLPSCGFLSNSQPSEWQRFGATQQDLNHTLLRDCYYPITICNAKSILVLLSLYFQQETNIWESRPLCCLQAEFYWKNNCLI